MSWLPVVALLLVASPALAQSVEVRDTDSGAQVRLEVDRPVQLVLRDRPPVRRSSRCPYMRGGCPYARDLSYRASYRHRAWRRAARRARVAKAASFLAAVIVGYSVISIVRSISRLQRQG